MMTHEMKRGNISIAGQSQVVWGEAIRYWVETKRYWFSAAGLLVGLYAFFLLLFLGATFLAPQMELEWLIAGYLIFVIFGLTYQTPSNMIITGASDGTLEQRALSPWGLGWVMTGATIADVLYNSVVTSLLLTAALLTSGQSVAIPWMLVGFLVVIVALQGYGIGCVLGGLALIFKRPEGVVNLIQLAVPAALAVPWELHPLVRLIPLRWPYHLLERVLGVGPEVTLWDPEMWGCLLVSIGFVVIGWSLFKRSFRAARKMGHLGHY